MAKSKFERKLDRFLRKIGDEYYLDTDQKLPQDEEREILSKISEWIYSIYDYVSEGNDDTWITSIEDAIGKARHGRGKGDCDDLAMMLFYIAGLFGIKTRLAVLYQKQGRNWYNNCHMAVLYKDKIVPSTKAIAVNMITRHMAFKNGWWVHRSFTKTHQWIYEKPRVENV